MYPAHDTDLFRRQAEDVGEIDPQLRNPASRARVNVQHPLAASYSAMVVRGSIGTPVARWTEISSGRRVPPERTSRRSPSRRRLRCRCRDCRAPRPAGAGHPASPHRRHAPPREAPHRRAQAVRPHPWPARSSRPRPWQPVRRRNASCRTASENGGSQSAERRVRCDYVGGCQQARAVRDRRQSVGEVIGAGQHREYAGCRKRSPLVERDDSRMRMGRADDHRMREVRRREIVDKAAATGEEAVILLPPHRLTDAVRGCSDPFIRDPGPGSASPPCARSARSDIPGDPVL